MFTGFVLSAFYGYPSQSQKLALVQTRRDLPFPLVNYSKRLLAIAFVSLFRS